MRISVILPLVVLAAALAACQTITPEQQRAADESKCAGYGFRPGTSNFANCMMKLDLDRNADRRAFMYGDDDDFFWGPTVVVGGGYYGGHRHWRHY